jgi:phenylacetaldehyde dehydrogenase
MAVQLLTQTIELSAAARAFLERPKKLLIGGEWVDAASGETFATENPATGEVITHVASAGKADVDAAVEAATRAFKEWRALPPVARAKFMYRIGELIYENLEELAQLESLDTGKPVSAARALDVPFTAENFQYLAGWATKLSGETFDISLSGDEWHAYTLREPAGVAAGIIPWNYPLAQASFKIAPALAAGCTIILKPAEQTPLTALRLGELILEAGVPAGVVNILTGFGHTAGAAIAAHPGINKISFTGSTEVGKLILKASAESNLKRVTLELGGKSPTIIFANSDLKQAIPVAANAIFGNSGQVCNAGSRLYVEKAVYEEVLDGVAKIAQNLKLGYGLDPNTELGPLVSKAQKDRVSSYVAAGLQDGAQLVTGGTNGIDDRGYFFQPTILTNTRPEMSVVREEIFGPVLVAEAFEDPDEIEKVANSTIYGLAATIFTKDLSQAHRLARRLNAGAVWINCFGVFDPNLPFGGYKQSGIGREMARLGVEAFTEVKAVTIRL